MRISTSTLATFAIFASIALDANANIAMNIGGNAFQPELQDIAHAQCFMYDTEGIHYSVAFSGCTKYGGLVVASLPRIPNDSTMTVYIDGYHNGTGTTYCTLVSRDWDGRPVAHKSQDTGNMIGNWELTLSMTPDEAPYWAYLFAECTMAQAGVIRGVLLN